MDSSHVIYNNKFVINMENIIHIYVYNIVYAYTLVAHLLDKYQSNVDLQWHFIYCGLYR